MNLSSNACGAADRAGQVATICRLVVPSGTSTSTTPSVTVTAVPLAVTVGVPGPVSRNRSRVPVAVPAGTIECDVPEPPVGVMVGRSPGCWGRSAAEPAALAVVGAGRRRGDVHGDGLGVALPRRVGDRQRQRPVADREVVDLHPAGRRVETRGAARVGGDGHRVWRLAASHLDLDQSRGAGRERPALDHGRGRRRRACPLALVDLDRPPLVADDELRRERHLGAEHVGADVEADLAVEGDQQVLNADVEAVALVHVADVDPGALHVEALERLVGAEEAQDLRRGVVGVEVEDDRAEPEADLAVLVDRDRRLHPHQLARSERARGVEAPAAPGREAERRRGVEAVVAHLVEQDRLGQDQSDRVGDARVLDDPVAGVELPGQPVRPQVEVELIEQQLQAEPDARVLRGGRSLLDGQELVEQALQRGQLRDRRGPDRGVDEGSAVARHCQPEPDLRRVPGETCRAARAR